MEMPMSADLLERLWTCLPNLSTNLQYRTFKKSQFKRLNCDEEQDDVIKVYEHKCITDWEPHAQLDFGNPASLLMTINELQLVKTTDWTLRAFNTNSCLWTTDFLPSFPLIWAARAARMFSSPFGMGGRTAFDGISRLFWQSDQKLTQSDAMKLSRINQRTPGWEIMCFCNMSSPVLWFNLAHGTISMYTSGIHK